jgi:excisionase family DNA binding protein
MERDKPATPVYDTPGMTSKPLYKIAEVCAMFQVTKPTIYEWIKHGKLKPFKIRSRVFFLSQDIQQLLYSAKQ